MLKNFLASVAQHFDELFFKLMLYVPVNKVSVMLIVLSWLTLCVCGTPKQDLSQTVKTQMKCSIMVYTVCKGKKRSSDKRI